MRHFWTDEEIHQEALKYQSKGEFRDSNAYYAAKHRKLLGSVCSHMTRKIHNWTNEEIRDEARKYQTRKAFRDNSTKAYHIAVNRNLMNEICEHMILSNGISSLENTLFEKIKIAYPTTKRLRDNKVKIAGKPHIHGFDIDIYIPELYKGIEFDGEYWHSTTGLKRSREHWPIEDLQHYHEIKDAYFLSRKIQLLHIKEIDWLSNNKICLQKCFNFLKNSK